MQWQWCKNALKYVCSQGSAPDPSGWACGAPLGPLALLKGSTSKEREGEGRDAFPQTQIHHYTTVHVTVVYQPDQNVVCRWNNKRSCTVHSRIVG